jgi:hypothetical protein
MTFPKIRRPKARPPEATPKETAAWKAFMEFAEVTQSADGHASPMVMMELKRLCEKGNPIALSFRSKVDREVDGLRAANEPGKAPPERRAKSAGVKWGEPPSIG